MALYRAGNKVIEMTPTTAAVITRMAGYISSLYIGYEAMYHGLSSLWVLPATIYYAGDGPWTKIYLHYNDDFGILYMMPREKFQIFMDMLRRADLPSRVDWKKEGF
jgi:hypothetical protein